MSTDIQTPAPAAGGRGARSSGKGDGRRRGPFARASQYLREVREQLSKVIKPSRQELITYVTVVLVFVTFMVLLVSAIDFGVTHAVLAVFG